MINNRQNGRRRGRGGGGNGGQRQGGNPNMGNRIDNRARGNAAQLLEKYKTLARDAQMQGDRVNTEYYLQFADHYFRVLSEQRGRFEEQNQRRQRDESFDGDDEDYGDEGEPTRADEQNGAINAQSRDDRRERGEYREYRDREGGRDQRREARGPRRDDRDREPRIAAEDGADASAPAASAQVTPANDVEDGASPKRRTRTRKPRETDEGDAPATLDLAVLPPSLGNGAAEASEGGEVAEKPRRRRTRPASVEA